MFDGSFERHIDKKGRIVIPKAYIAAIKKKKNLSKLVIAKDAMGDEIPFLDFYTPDGWRKLRRCFESIDKEQKIYESHEAFYNYYILSAAKVELDKNNRMGIPSFFRSHIQFNDLKDTDALQDIVIVGCKNKFQVFKHQHYLEYNRQIRKVFAPGDRFTEVRNFLNRRMK